MQNSTNSKNKSSLKKNNIGNDNDVNKNVKGRDFVSNKKDNVNNKENISLNSDRKGSTKHNTTKGGKSRMDNNNNNNNNNNGNNNNNKHIKSTNNNRGKSNNEDNGNNHNKKGNNNNLSKKKSKQNLGLNKKSSFSSGYNKKSNRKNSNSDNIILKVPQPTEVFDKSVETVCVSKLPSYINGQLIDNGMDKFINLIKQSLTDLGKVKLIGVEPALALTISIILILEEQKTIRKPVILTKTLEDKNKNLKSGIIAELYPSTNKVISKVSK
ncbi:hypothetical protein BCR32DRAFT_264911 [Anaeromyces robustus]|uniref:Uncharacterized protein n=1 Tax=Anaeromyces robustus TaxID=1754192 RepID=A0A1Y1XL82_9FUNG|nr:hypothetical protein BCR32DRAFT_264911 [Anaeromyces robustus]|eukprot:ORX86520.1 hypothetical protein BCR32DRAFT_264911 [Anaeromyces robustus]